jgi:hypothetical protein
LPVWIRLASVSAVAQIALALTSIVVASLRSGIQSVYWLGALQMVVWSATAAYMILGGRSDPRAKTFGTVLLLIGSSFAYSPARALEAVDFPALASLAFIKRYLREDALIPAALWLFARDFPRDLPTAFLRRRIERVIFFYVFVGVLLSAVNLALAFVPASVPFLQAVSVDHRNSHYWTLVYGSSLVAIFFVLWKAHRTPADERARAFLFTLGLVAGCPASAYIVLASVFKGFTPALREAGWFPAVSSFVLALALAVPATTAYSVAVDRVLDVHIVLRGAVQYGLARSLAAILAGVPFIWMAAFVYRMRGETLATLFSGRSLFLITGSAVAGVTLVASRRMTVDGIDRLFFRERYDARKIVVRLVERIPRSGTVAELSDLLSSELDRAFHPEDVGLFVIDEREQFLRPVRPGRRELQLSSELAYLLAVEERPMTVDLEKNGSRLRRLPGPERHWIVDSKFRVLVPVLGSDRRLLGLIGLGDRRSELPYKSEDKELLGAFAAATTLSLESLRQSKLGRFGPSTVDETARECPDCSTVYDHGTERCSSCRKDLLSAVVPRDLLGKFRLEKRVGRGAMGVVYLATDMTLGRAVAIKTLPRTSPEDAVALRREARAMASIQHPHLAMIFGAESWNGYPVLVLEFLDHGTLAERIDRGPIAISEVVNLGVALSSALQKTHDAGLLHGDVKPSNIGFTKKDAPKLMDFGLARLYQHAPASAAHAVNGADAQDAAGMTMNDGGTLLYMSPEAISRGAPEPAFDLWSLALVLYEAIARQNPLERENAESTRRAILDADLPDIRDLRPDCPAPIAGFFRSELSRKALDRAQTGKEFRFRMRAVEKELRRLADYAEDSMKKI